MTDNEIIKAYDGLTANQQLNLYRNLYYNQGGATEKGIIANAINDILPKYNRQKAEIERLTINMNAFGLGMIREKERADNAVREFAERLKLHSYIVSDESKTGIITRYSVVTANQIDSLVEEMVGEGK